MIGWLFLVVSLWGAWFTWNAYRPVYDRPNFSVLSFFAGWLTKELALHHLLWQVAATVGFVLLGAAATVPGKVAIVITVVSWAGLLHQLGVARQAERAVKAALTEGLGDDFESEIPERYRKSFEGGTDWRQVLLPFPIRHRAVTRHRDIVYKEASGIRLKLDVYTHADRPRRAPVLVQVHGGGWTIGSKDEQGLVLMNRLASHGWVCVAMNYRLSPRATFPDHLVDVKEAIAWTKAHIAEYGGDPEFVVITGGSAGGHLSALAALTPNDPRFQPGFEDADTSVRACVPFYGIYDFTNLAEVWPHHGLDVILRKNIMKTTLAENRELYEAASPVHQIGAHAPPFFVLHGDHDTLVPVEAARRFVAELRERSPATTLYAEIPQAQHAWEIFPSLRTSHTLDAVERFLTWVYARWVAERAVGGADAQRTKPSKRDLSAA